MQYREVVFATNTPINLRANSCNSLHGAERRKAENRRYIVQLFLRLVLGSLLQLIFPFLTQGIVDYGISNQNLGVVTLILIVQARGDNVIAIIPS